MVDVGARAKPWATDERDHAAHADVVADAGAGDVPLDVTVFMDYHCPYSYRATCWLDDLGPAIVRPRYRFFALEQVNHDPDAEAWRLWEQPLDYLQYRERQDRRSLAAFIATHALDELASRDAAAWPLARLAAFRRAIYEARFDDRADISRPDVLDAAGVTAGLEPGTVAAWLADAEIASRARARIAADWAAGREPWRIFGVPTLVIGEEPPFYLRLADRIVPEAGREVLATLRALRSAAPEILEIKQPEPAAPR